MTLEQLFEDKIKRGWILLTYDSEKRAWVGTHPSTQHVLELAQCVLEQCGSTIWFRVGLPEPTEQIDHLPVSLCDCTITD